MPQAPLTYCAAQGCSAKVASGYCAVHRSADSHRRLTENGHRLYNTKRWKLLRDQVRVEAPFCQMPGCHRVTDHIDHIVPHRGDESLFFMRDNCQGLCVEHHAQKSAGER